MRDLKQKLRLYLVSDFTLRPDTFVLSQTEKALYGGTTAVQYRDKSAASLSEKAVRCNALGALARRAGALFIVNDNLELALNCHADGIHLGNLDLSLELALKRSPDNFIIGGSTHDPEQAKTLEKQGADYLGVGAVYEARPSKPNASSPIGCTILRKIAGAVNIPIVAIGGITVENVSSVWSTGVDGVAVIRAILDAADPAYAAKRLYSEKDRGKNITTSCPHL
jgi:thiamine-phosphate pyrophosphorylase